MYSAKTCRGRRWNIPSVVKGQGEVKWQRNWCKPCSCYAFCETQILQTPISGLNTSEAGQIQVPAGAATNLFVAVKFCSCSFVGGYEIALFPEPFLFSGRGVKISQVKSLRTPRKTAAIRLPRSFVFSHFSFGEEVIAGQLPSTQKNAGLFPCDAVLLKVALISNPQVGSRTLQKRVEFFLPCYSPVAKAALTSPVLFDKARIVGKCQQLQLPSHATPA
jgi:hypothetical protein